jgi:hypothetical protein
MNTFTRFLLLLVTLSFADAIRIDCDVDKPYRIEIHTRRVLVAKRLLVNGVEVAMSSLASKWITWPHQAGPGLLEISDIYRIGRMDEYSNINDLAVDSIYFIDDNYDEFFFRKMR